MLLEDLDDGAIEANIFDLVSDTFGVLLARNND